MTAASAFSPKLSFFNSGISFTAGKSGTMRDSLLFLTPHPSQPLCPVHAIIPNTTWLCFYPVISSPPHLSLGPHHFSPGSCSSLLIALLPWFSPLPIYSSSFRQRDFPKRQLWLDDFFFPSFNTAWPPSTVPDLKMCLLWSLMLWLLPNSLATLSLASPCLVLYQWFVKWVAGYRCSFVSNRKQIRN